jgi:hypothetical protein
VEQAELMEQVAKVVHQEIVVVQGQAVLTGQVAQVVIQGLRVLMVVMV